MVKVSYHDKTGWENVQPTNKQRLEIINEMLKRIDDIQNDMDMREPDNGKVIKKAPNSRNVRKHIKNMTNGQLVDYLDSLTNFVGDLYLTLVMLEKQQDIKDYFDSINVSPEDAHEDLAKETVKAIEYDWKHVDKSEKADKKRFAELTKAENKLAFLSGVCSGNLAPLTGGELLDFNKMSLNDIIDFANRLKVMIENTKE